VIAAVGLVAVLRLLVGDVEVQEPADLEQLRRDQVLRLFQALGIGERSIRFIERDGRVGLREELERRWASVAVLLAVVDDGQVLRVRGVVERPAGRGREEGGGGDHGRAHRARSNSRTVPGSGSMTAGGCGAKSGATRVAWLQN